MKRALVLLAAALAVPLGAAGCEEKKAPSDTARADASAGTDKYATADPKLAKALQAAASASAAAAGDGPPVTGIFAPGVADKKHRKGAPTTVEPLGDGAEPRVALLPAGDASLPDSTRTTSYGQAVLEYAQQQGQRSASPTLDFAMVLGPAKKDDGGIDGLVAAVKQVMPAREQMAQLPPGMDKEVASLNGSEIHLRITADGRASDVTTALPKGARPELDRLVLNAAEALAMATVPLPPRPVGVGGQWIAESRMSLGGVDAIVYRAYRVKGADGDRMHLTLSVKAYAADKDVQLGGVPKGANLEQFDDSGEGDLDLVRGETLARKFDLQGRMVLVFSPPGGAPPPQPGQPPGQGMMTAQIGTQATFVRGDDLRQAMKQ